MRFKKFLVIPVLLAVMWYGYFGYVDSLISGAASLNTGEKPTTSAGGEVIGVGTAVSVQVIRPYFFGLLELPIYTPSGSIAGMHSSFFFWFFATPILLTTAFLIIEW